MRRRMLLAGCVALGGCGLFPAKRPLEGTWVITSATLGGQPLPLSSFDGGTLVLDAGRYAFRDDRGDYVVLPGTSPGQLDVHGSDGPNAGRTFLAIFALDADALTICYDLSGTQRPTRFESLPGTRQFLVRYRRG